MKKVMMAASALLIAVSPMGWTNGIFITPGTNANAMGDAYVAVADDASAIYWNPAGLAQLKGNGVEVSAITAVGETTTNEPLKNVSGKPDVYNNDFPLKKIWPTEPSQFTTKDFNVSATLPFAAAYFEYKGTVFAIGSYASSGGGGTYQDTSWAALGGRINSEINGQFYTMVDNISIARQICPQLSAGVGVDFITMCNQENVSKVYEGAVSPMTNYSFLDKQNDSGNGLQANVGLMYTPAPKWKTGFVYRTGTTINLGGSTSLNVNGLSAFGLGDYASAYTQSYYYPETYAVGASYDPSEKWTLAVAVLQNDYSPSRLDISYRNPQSSIGFVSTNISENDNNTTQYCLGAAYHYTPVWTFRAGVFNDPTQEPTNQLTIYNTNEFNMMYYSLGAGYTKGAIGLSLMLAYGMSDSPSVNGINYTYSTDILRAEAKYSF